MTPSARRALALAIAALFARGALADSQAGADNAVGQPRGDTYDPTVPRDARGKATMLPALSRTPTGLLYDWAYLEPLTLPLASGWAVAGAAEAGAIGKTHDAASNKFREYRDWRNGAIVNALSLSAERGGHFFGFSAVTPGREDQGYEARFGRWGLFGLGAFLSDIPHVFATGVRTPYSGVGTGRLTLPGLVPGNNTPAEVLAAANAAGPIELALRRRRAGLDIDVTPDEQWRFFARYTHESRDGERPFGGTIGFNFPASPVSGGLAEIVEPIKYRTHDFTAGVQLARDTYQVNLAYSGSFFRNEIGALTWDNPFRVNLLNPTAPAIALGQTDLAPNNNHHNVKLDFSRAALPLNGQLTGSFSLHRMTQDDALLPPTVNGGVIQAVNATTGALLGTIDLANWNTTAALSRQSANARLDTWVGQLAYAFMPLRDLNMRARWRRYDEDNKTRYTAFNPLTGQFGYLAADGAIFVSGAPAFNGIVFPGNLALTTLPIHVRAAPYAYQRDNAGLEADYRLASRTRLEAAYEREEYRRDHRERAKTWEDRVRVGLNIRQIPWATIRTSYEYAKRSGGEYIPDPYTAEFYLSNRAPGVPPYTLADLRKLDLSDRRQHLLNARVNVILRDDMDLMVSAKLADNAYGADYGRRGDTQHNVGVDWSFQPRPETGAFAHYDYQQMRLAQANINDNSAAALAGSGDARAGGAVYPFANQWDATTRDRTHTFSTGLRYALPRARIDTSYSFVRSRQAIGYGFASPGALTIPAIAREADDGMPDMTMRRHILETSVTYGLRWDMALRLYHRYERGRYQDWAYDGLPLVVENELFLGAGPRSYSTHVVGLLFQYRLGKEK